VDSPQALMLSDRDNVASVLANVSPGADVVIRPGPAVITITATEEIPFGFKMAVAAIARGSPVIKYGESIGVASQDIRPGQLVHIHNIEGTRGRGDLPAGAGEAP
jgi:altronate dehydratase small subunit